MLEDHCCFTRRLAAQTCNADTEPGGWREDVGFLRPLHLLGLTGGVKIQREGRTLRTCDEKRAVTSVLRKSSEQQCRFLAQQCETLNTQSIVGKPLHSDRIGPNTSAGVSGASAGPDPSAAVPLVSSPCSWTSVRRWAATTRLGGDRQTQTKILSTHVSSW